MKLLAFSLLVYVVCLFESMSSLIYEDVKERKPSFVFQINSLTRLWEIMIMCSRTTEEKVY